MNMQFFIVVARRIMRLDSDTIKQRPRGVALLLVLGSLVLLTALLLSFMFAVRGDRKASKIYADVASVRLTADSVLNLVMSEVAHATQGVDVTGAPLAWTSQPGMIRTFDQTGTLYEAHKLYSWAGMVSKTFSANAPDELPPDDWASQPALFTDLNAPLRDHYPVMHPRAVGKVEGFKISGAPGTTSDAPVMPVYWLYKLKDGTWVTPERTADGKKAHIQGASRNNPIVARAGFWTDDETAKLNINTASEGQFWDSPRWMTPFELNLGLAQPAKNEYQRYPGHPFTTSLSPVLAGYVTEVSRATPLEPEVAVTGGFKGSYANRSEVERLLKNVYALSPRLSWGGSEGGTVPFAYTTPAVPLKSDRLYATVDELAFRAPPSATARSPKDRNLLAGTAADPIPISEQTLEEWRFFLTANSRAPEVNLFNQPRVSIWPVDDPTKKNPVRGALQDTAKDLVDQQSPLDKLLAFCSTLGTGASAKPFYFVRSNPTSATADLASGSRNEQLYSYLLGFTKKLVPGFGGQFSVKYPQDYQQILTEIFDYIRITNLLYAGGPSPDSTFKADFRYSFMPPPSTAGVGSASSQRHILAFAGGEQGGPYADRKSPSSYAASGQVVPILGPNDTKGFGNFPTLSSLAVMFIVSQVSPNDETGKPNYVWDISVAKWIALTGSNSAGYGVTQRGNGIPSCPDIFYKWEDLVNHGDYAAGSGDVLSPFDKSLPDGCVRMQAVLLVNPFLVSPGYPGANPDYRITIKGLESFKADNNSMDFPSEGTLIMSGNFQGPSTGDKTLTNSYSAFAASPGLMTTYLGRNLGVSDPPSRNYYPFFARHQPVVKASTFEFSGGALQVEIGTNGNAYDNGMIQTVQTLNVRFPSATFPTPELPKDSGGIYAMEWGESNSNFDKTKACNTAYAIRHFGDSQDAGGATPATLDIADKRYGRFRQNATDGSGWSYGLWDARFIMPTVADVANVYTTPVADLVQSVEVAHGDTRLIAGLRTVPEAAFAPHVDYGVKRAAHSFRRGNFGSYYYGVKAGSLMASGTYAYTAAYRPPSGMTGNINYEPMVGSRIGPGHWPSTWDEGGDWDSGISRMPDGPFINKPDEGTGYGDIAGGAVPYFAALDNMSFFSAVGANRVSPNRIMPSPVMFGSLSTGVHANRPWQTLLFCPNPRAGDTHFALQSSPSDHLILDLFQMPVVEPYAISEPFSTAGKVNMNYRLVPFRHITRDAALRGILKAAKISAVPDSDISTYKGGSSTGLTPLVTNSYRYPIHADETLKAFEDRFDGKITGKPEVFKSASEICELFLYPASQSNLSTALVNYVKGDSSVKSWWSDKNLTGDNLREQPYAVIYPRLTTKSNTFTVHMQVQTLIKVKGDVDQDVWNESRDVVAGEYRGSVTFERFIDPNEPGLPDFATESNKSIDSYYQFRVLNTKEFKP